MDGTTSGLLDSVTQRTLYAQNFNRASSQASHVLTDLLCRYISLLASTCARYADHAGRTTVAMPDAILALDELGLSVDELFEYVEREGNDLRAEGYTTITSRRAEELTLLKGHYLRKRVFYTVLIVLLFIEIHRNSEGRQENGS